jgi:hypothetical protein
VWSCVSAQSADEGRRVTSDVCIEREKVGVEVEGVYHVFLGVNGVGVLFVGAG